MKKSTEKIGYNLQMPPDLKSKVERLADEEHRSQASLMIHILSVECDRRLEKYDIDPENTGNPNSHAA